MRTKLIQTTSQRRAPFFEISPRWLWTAGNYNISRFLQKLITGVLIKNRNNHKPVLYVALPAGDDACQHQLSYWQVKLYFKKLPNFVFSYQLPKSLVGMRSVIHLRVGNLPRTQ